MSLHGIECSSRIWGQSVSRSTREFHEMEVAGVEPAREQCRSKYICCQHVCYYLSRKDLPRMSIADQSTSVVKESVTFFEYRLQYRIPAERGRGGGCAARHLKKRRIKNGS